MNSVDGKRQWGDISETCLYSQSVKKTWAALYLAEWGSLKSAIKEWTDWGETKRDGQSPGPQECGGESECLHQVNKERTAHLNMLRHPLNIQYVEFEGISKMFSSLYNFLHLQREQVHLHRLGCTVLFQQSFRKTTFHILDFLFLGYVCILL